MSERTIERELKFSAPADFAPDFSGLVEVLDESTFDLDATYHDTPALHLREAGWSLRRRSGGHDAGWHLKRPAEDGARTEVQAADAASVPDDLRQEVRELAKLAPVVPVARLRTRRTETTLGRGGEPVALMARDTVRATTASGEEEWQEVEVELVGNGDAALLAELAAVLERAGATPAPHASKVARALGAAEPVAALGSDATGRDVLMAWAATQTGVLQAREADVRTNEPDAVHKSRVATRRFRSMLKTFRKLFDRTRSDALRAELRWLAEMLGAPRDAEVLAEEFEELLAKLGDQVPAESGERVLRHLHDQHDRAHQALLEALDSERAAALRTALVDFLLDPPLKGRADRPASEVLPPLRQKAIDEVEALRALARKHPEELEHWHDVRKAAKAVRYATEALQEALPELEPEVDVWTDVTEAYGVLQDTAVATDLIDRVAEENPDVDPSVWQVLRAAQVKRREAAFVEGEEALSVALD